MEFLEDVLNPQEPGRPPALEIAQAWSNLRTQNQNPQVIQQSLLLLECHRRSLHILESQVRILISCARIPSSTGIELVGSIRASAALLISTWVRRNFPSHAHNRKPTSSTVSLLHTAAEAFCGLLQEPGMSGFYVCQGILLLGSICSSLDCNHDIKYMCQEAIAGELADKKDAIVNSCSISDALAGVGYAIMVSRESVLDSIMNSLMLLWIPTSEDPPLTVSQMIVKLFEAVGARVDRTVLDRMCTSLVNSEARNFVVSAVGGLCRGARDMDGLTKERLESLISDVADHLIRDARDAFPGEMQFDIFSKLPGSVLHQFRCVSLACASYTVSKPSFSVLQCMVYVLLGDVLNIYQVHSSVAEVKLGNLKTLTQGLMFKQGGALVRAICIQHRKCSMLHQREIETLFWRYSLELYRKHRVWELYSVHELPDEDLKKVREAAFVSVVMFFASAIDLLHGEDMSDRACDLVVSVLDAFSCFEHLRHVPAPTGTQQVIQVPEYSIAMRKCALTVSKSTRASVHLTNLFPIYDDVISSPGGFENTTYSWHSDVVQTSRVVFYFRVLPSCINKLDDTTFESRIVPIMFLYLCNTYKQVAEAAHNLFALFVSQRTDSVDKDDTQVSLAEQLGVYYIIRSMEGYPRYTPLEGLVSGVMAIAKYLPPGSVTTLHCIDELVKKADYLFSVANSKESDEAAHNIQVLLLRLMLVVDIQVLPRLLEQLAKLILSLPSEAQKKGVDEAFAVISNAEDYVRKLTLVTWVQSLGFLSANQQSSSYHSRL